MHEQTNGLWCASLAQVSSTAHQLSFKCERCVPGNPHAKKKTSTVCHLTAIWKVKNKKYSTHLGKKGRRIENGDPDSGTVIAGIYFPIRNR